MSKYVGFKIGKVHEEHTISEYYCGGCGWPVTDHDSYCPECGGALHQHDADSSDAENAKLREQGERLFDKTLELATENVRLQDENARLRSCLSDDAENARMIMAENEKLRELCATVIDDWMSKVCPSFPFCEFGGEYQDCTDETCGNQIYRQMARELGIEVDDA